MTEFNHEISGETTFYRKKLLLSLFIPAVFVFLMWFVKIIELLFDMDLSFLGIYPSAFRG